MDRKTVLDLGPAPTERCAIGRRSGPGSGKCQNPACGRLVSYLIGGLCSTCAHASGIQPITVSPDAACGGGNCKDGCNC